MADPVKGSLRTSSYQYSYEGIDPVTKKEKIDPIQSKEKIQTTFIHKFEDGTNETALQFKMGASEHDSIQFMLPETDFKKIFNPETGAITISKGKTSIQFENAENVFFAESSDKRAPLLGNTYKISPDERTADGKPRFKISQLSGDEKKKLWQSTIFSTMAKAKEGKEFEYKDSPLMLQKLEVQSKEIGK